LGTRNPSWSGNFQSSHRGGEQQSLIEFEVDLAKLGATELERLRQFLESRHAGLTGSAEYLTPGGVDADVLSYEYEDSIQN
jgi:hypothetical protein